MSRLFPPSEDGCCSINIQSVASLCQSFQELRANSVRVGKDGVLYPVLLFPQKNVESLCHYGQASVRCYSFPVPSCTKTENTYFVIKKYTCTLAHLKSVLRIHNYVNILYFKYLLLKICSFAICLKNNSQ